jgi:Zn-dependent M28 family amino/carboxypeptidase
MEAKTIQAGSAAAAAEFSALDRDLCGEIWAGGAAAAMLETLCVDYGGRFAGSANYRGAAEYVSRTWSASGLQNVHFEEFPILSWERGSASLIMLTPAQRTFPCISLPPAPACDLEADALDLGYGIEPDLAAAGAAVRGKIVLVRSGAPPGIRAPHRLEKYIRAREAGAAGFLFADGEPGMLSPTGSLPSEPEGPLDQDIPGAGIPYEAGVELGRWLSRGPVRLRLQLENTLRHDASWNVVGELPGRDPAGPLTLVGGHLDGHDIGQAAIDNASGIVAVSEAARALAAHAPRLAGTIRIIAFGAEEFGMWGSYAYAAAHRAELDRVRFFYNLDCVGTPGQLGLLLQNCAELAPYYRKLAAETGADYAVNEMLVPFSDQFPFTMEGVPSAFIATHGGGGGRGWGHTSADTLDKVDVRAIRNTAATVARLAARSADDAAWPGRRRSPDETRDALKAQGVEAQLRLLGAWPF